jgi:hypothetical protein
MLLLLLLLLLLLPIMINMMTNSTAGYGGVHLAGRRGPAREPQHHQVLPPGPKRQEPARHQPTGG